MLNWGSLSVPTLVVGMPPPFVHKVV